MHDIRCIQVTTRRELDDALAVRWKVFGDEMGLLARRAPFVAREPHPYDTLESTLHFVAYDRDIPVGTVRMLLPSQHVARTNGLRLGLDLERKFDLGDLAGAPVSLAEITRVCILQPWRRSAALRSMYRLMFAESRRRGVTHWIGSANCDTDSLDDARIAYRLVQRCGLASERWRVQPFTAAVSPATPRKPFYPQGTHLQVQAGRFDGLMLPPLIAHYARKLGARYLGEPIYDTDFHLCSMPLIVALCDIPSTTLRERRYWSPERAAAYLMEAP